VGGIPDDGGTDVDAGPDGIGVAEALIGTEGGSVTLGEASITVPSGAVAAPVTLRIVEVAGASTPGYTRYSPVYRFEPSGIEFAAPVRVSLPYEGDASRATLFWTYPGRSSFERVGGVESGGRVQGEVTHFSEGFVGDGIEYTDPPDLSCLVTRLIEGRNASDAGIRGGIALFFAVEDCEGRPVTGLEASDFALLEDGEELSSEAQATVLRQEGVGVFVSLVLDLSSSTEPVLDELLAGAQAFVDTLESASLPVQVQVLAFGGEPQASERQRHTLDLDVVRSALEGLQTWQPSDVGSTNLNGAVVQALQQSEESQAAYRERNLGGAFSTGYVVVFTDGRDTARRVDLATVQGAVSSSSDTLMVVGLRGADWRPESIAELGARYTVAATEPGQLAREFSAVANRIAGQASRTYLVGYCSPSRAGSHTVAVSVSGTETREQAVYDFDATGFDGSCRASAFETVCEGNACGGLGCGACDDREGACVDEPGAAFACVDHCTLLGECNGETSTTELGYEVFCAAVPTRTDCGGVCRDLTSDDAHCGSCGTRCASGGTCESGSCACPGADGRDCGGVCRDVAVDVSNCGACGVSCGANATGCTEGRCVCATGWSGARCEEPVCTGGCGTNSRCVAPDRCECNDGFAGPTCSIGVALGFSFALINAGTFTMGSPSGELGRVGDETQHTVTLTRRFLMQTTEVTQAQWTSLSGGVNPSCFQSTTVTECSTSNANDSGPVERVDWYSAVAFANALSVREGLSACYSLTGCSDAVDGWQDGQHSGCTGATFAGLSCTGYRLPTESEWEYAARAGTTTATYAGNLTSIVCDDRTLPPIAWFCGNSGNRTQAVAQKTPNAWGLYDMLGNVWEWTWDWYGTYPGTVTDPTGPTSGSDRVLRGGSWIIFGAQSARAAIRDLRTPAARGNNSGFRLARSLP
ncbi:MAG: SUMF1/EgtB/PvdO family nonheme iron enzyme, partial [Myxococcales bacterium]|nr:SUMF1/EgtB/PvdO family nonheme iron enzyme [Myxococcales bacterium]